LHPYRDDSDPHDEIAHLEARIEELTAKGRELSQVHPGLADSDAGLRHCPLRDARWRELFANGETLAALKRH
jgi:hypothetical protein